MSPPGKPDSPPRDGKERPERDPEDVRRLKEALRESDAARRQAEEAGNRQTALLAAINRVLEMGLGRQTEEQMCQACLGVVEQATGSTISFIGEIGADGLLHDLAISNPGWDACKMYDQAGNRKPPGGLRIHGIYGRVLSDGKALIVNDPASHPDGVALPQGHPPLTSFLGVPLLRDGKIIGMLAGGNRRGGYSVEHQRTLEAIAPAIVQAVDRKRAEEALRASEELFRNFFDNAPLGKSLTTPDGILERANPALCRMLGYTQDELAKLSFLDITHPEDERISRECVRALLAGERDTWEMQKRYLAKDGRVVWTQVVTSLLRDASGRPLRFLTHVLDITARKQAEAELQKAHGEMERRVEERTAELLQTTELAKAERQRLYDVLETLPAYVCLLAADYRMPFANRRFREWFDYDPDRKCYEFLFNRGEPCEQCETYNVLKRHGPHHWEWTGPNGRAYDVFDFPFFDTDGSPLILEMGIDVTERKRAEAALNELNETLELRVAQRTAELRQSREDLARAETVGQIGWWRLDTRQDVLTWSDENHRIFGVPSGTPLTYETFKAIVHPDDRDFVDARWAAGLRGEPYDIEHRIVVGGQVKWVREKAYLEFDDQDALQGAFGITQDITARKEVEQSLRRSEERYRTLFDSMTEGFALHEIVTDEQGRPVDYRFLEVNPAFERLTGLKRAGLLGKRVLEVLPATEAYWIESYGRVALTGEPAHFENHSTELDRWYEVFAYRSAPRQFAVVFTDITVRKQAEEALRELNATLESKVAERTAEVVAAGRKVQAERQRLYDVLEALPAMVCLLTPDHHVPFANRSFRERFGEPNGRRCYEFCFGRDQACDFCESYKALETGRPHHWEVNAPDGSVIDAYDFPFTDADGSPMILEMDMDITEIRKTQTALRQANEQLAGRAGQLRALAGELTLSEQRERRRMAKLLHDHLQQLLIGCKFRLAVLGRHEDPVVQQATAEATRLLDDAVGASRSLTAELSPPILHEAGLAEGLQWLARWMADKHGLFVELSLPKEPLPLAEDVKLLLFECARELLFNVVKHAQAKSATVSLRRLVGSQVQLAVSDQGVGFDADSVKPGTAGGGFGLFSIRERVELIGGQMEVKSRPGQGSLLVLAAPMGRAPAAPAAPQAAGEPPGDGPAVQAVPAVPGAKIRVLLADDHAVMRQGLTQLLGQERDILVIGGAADGQEAVELAAKLSPDVILMDMNMPRLNGVEATRAIHHEYPDIRIIGLSMFEEAERSQAMRDAGAVDYLTKTGPAEHLVAAIRRACRPAEASGPAPVLAEPPKAPRHSESERSRRTRPRGGESGG